MNSVFLITPETQMSTSRTSGGRGGPVERPTSNAFSFLILFYNAVYFLTRHNVFKGNIFLNRNDK